jgi:CRISPR-associated endonuclease Csy4
MSHYLDIHLRPDPELPAHLLLSALYAKLHRAFVELQTNEIGITFPAYQSSPPSLGDHLRLVGPASVLERLISSSRLGGMRDHLRWEPVALVPATAEHRRLRRVQAKSNPARLRRRQMKRHGLSEAEALARVPDTAVKLLRLPFLQVRSASTGQPFLLFLELGAPQPEASEGEFNAYGLSTCRTVPWF